MGLQGLLDEIKKIIKARNIPATSVRTGILDVDAVLVGSTWYPASFAVDIDVDDGESVCVVLSDDGNTAVVVGKC